MFDFEGFDDAEVAAGLAAGPGHRLVRRNRAFEELFPRWNVGQEADAALTGTELQGVLRSLRATGGESRAVLVTLPGDATGAGRVPGVHLVSCLTVASRYGPSLLVLAVGLAHRPEDITVGLAHPAEDVTVGLPADARTELDRYKRLLSALPQLVWRMTPDGTVGALLDHLDAGQASLWYPQGQGATWMDAVHPKDRAAFARQWAATARGEAVLDEIVRVRQQGERPRYRPVKITAVPVVSRGKVVEWIGTVADAEAQWRQRTRDRLLERIAHESSVGDLLESFEAAAAAVVPELADAFVVFRLTRPGGARPEPLHAVRGRTVVAPGVLRPPALKDDFALGTLARGVIDSGSSELLTFPAGRPPRGVVSEDSVDWLSRTRATSLAILPVVIDDRTVALASASSCLGNPPISRCELGLMEELLSRLQDPLRRALELQSIRETALVLQRSFLVNPPDVAGAELAAVYRPASETAEIGGDWYDAVTLADGGLALSIGDVVGHDLGAATEMTKVSSMLRAFAYTDAASGPAHTLHRLDHVLRGVSAADLITALHAVLHRLDDDRWAVTFSNAGHPPPLLVPRTGPPRYLEGPVTADPPLCVMSGARRHDWRCDLGQGDILVFYTDGLVEVPGIDISDGLRRLARQAAASDHRAARLDRFVSGLLPESGAAQDDIAVIAFRAGRGVVPPRR